MPRRQPKAARRTAMEIGKGLGRVNILRCIDRDYGDLCWVIQVTRDSTIVVYDDEPNTQVAAGYRPGRFVETSIV
jgi:hypothetical protein